MGLIEKIGDMIGGVDEAERKEFVKEPEKEEAPAQNFEPKEQPTVTAGFAAGRNVVDFNSARPARESAARNSGAIQNQNLKTKITTIKPKNFKDAKTIANCLRDRIPVIMNFEDTANDEARRIIDFITGTTYAIDGEVKKVSESVFVCVPDNVGVSWAEDEKKSVSKFMD